MLKVGSYQPQKIQSSHLNSWIEILWNESFFELRMKISEGERDIRCRMNSLSGWKKQPEQIQAWPEMEPLPLRWLDATLYPLS